MMKLIFVSLVFLFAASGCATTYFTDCEQVRDNVFKGCKKL